VQPSLTHGSDPGVENADALERGVHRSVEHQVGDAESGGERVDPEVEHRDTGDGAHRCKPQGMDWPVPNTNMITSARKHILINIFIKNLKL
jgi:hypothetical protein